MSAGYRCWHAPAIALLVFAMLPRMGHARSPGPHVHGEAELNVVADGPTLQVHLKAPLDSVVGFEHAPRTEKQRDAVRAMGARMRQVAGLLVPTPDAQCSVTSVRLASSALPGDLLGDDKAAARAAQPAADHSDLDATFVFRCAAPEKLKGLESNLMKVFPGIRKMKVSVVGPRGQKALVLTKGRTSVPW